MNRTAHDLTFHLLDRLRQVRQNLGLDDGTPVDPGAALGDVLDSMAMVEFLALLAEDCATQAAAIEECVGRRFGTVEDLAAALQKAGLSPPRGEGRLTAQRLVLAATAVRLPERVQPAAEVDAALSRPAGWFASHAGIRGRRLWAEQDPLTSAAEAGRACLKQAGVLPEEVRGYPETYLALVDDARDFDGYSCGA